MLHTLSPVHRYGYFQIVVRRLTAAAMLLCALTWAPTSGEAQSFIAADWEPMADLHFLSRLPPLPEPEAKTDEKEESDESKAADAGAKSENSDKAGDKPAGKDAKKPAAELEEVKGVPVDDSKVDVPKEVPPPSPWDPWSGSVSLGLSGTDGNTETFNMRFGAKAKWETPERRHVYELTHIDKSNNGKRTALSTLLDSRIEWLFPDSPWSYFIHGSNEQDQFRAFDVRVQGDVGVGYERKTKKQSLINRFGGSFSREVGGPQDEYVPELSFTSEWKYTLNDRNKCMIKAEYFPDVTQFQEFRLNGRAEWETIVEPAWGLSLKLSAIDRFDSTPHGRKANDLDYSLLLLWNF